MSDEPRYTQTIEADVAEPTGEVVRRGGTFESFKHRSFTLFWSGAFVSNTGTWMQTAALGIVVYALRKSELDLGIVNFVSGIPVLFLALPGGVLADRIDKRMLLIWSQVLMGLQAAALWLLYRNGHLSASNVTGAMLWICGLGLIGGVLSALTFPGWQSFLPDLVPRKGLMNAIALNSAQFQLARLLGPLAAAGLIGVGVNTGEVFLVNAASFLFVIAALWAIRPCDARCRGEEEHPRITGGVWENLTAGLRYAREERVIGTLVTSTAVMSVFAMPYMMLLPAIAHKTLQAPSMAVSTQWYAWLMAANGLGAVGGSLVVASLPHDLHRERIIPFAMLVMAALLTAFSFSRWFWLSIVLSTLCGATFLTVNSLTNTSLQAGAPGHLRGRVMSLFVLAFMGFMPISAVAFGPLGKLVGPARAVLAGAVIVALWSAYLLISGKLSGASPSQNHHREMHGPPNGD